MTIVLGSIAFWAVRAATAQPTAPYGDELKIAGAWRGNSVCQVAGSPCHDETNVYRFLPMEGKAGAYSGTASKIVEGKDIVMGTSEWHYDAAKHALESSMPAATLRFIVDGDKMEGTLTLLDGKVYRRIHLVKAK